MPSESKRSKAKNKKGARSRKRVILEQGAEIFQTKKEHGAENSNHGARSTLYYDCALKNLRLRRLPSYFLPPKHNLNEKDQGLHDQSYIRILLGQVFLKYIQTGNITLFIIYD